MPNWDAIQKKIHDQCDSVWAHLKHIEKMDHSAATYFIQLFSSTPCWNQDPATRKIYADVMERYNETDHPTPSFKG